MKFENVYFFNGTAYAGKSTMVKKLAEKYDGIACEENYHEQLMSSIDEESFPNLMYTRNLKDWADFIRRTPEEYERWVDGVTLECAALEMRILEDLVQKTEKKIFVDTNIPVDMLRSITDTGHVMIMLADPMISVNRFFDRPDKEKQFLYRLLLAESDPQAAIGNFRECLKRINSQERYNAFLHAGFQVVHRDDERTLEETMHIIEEKLNLL